MAPASVYWEDIVIKQPTVGIVLAAGMSTRMGRAKQLLEIAGKPLLTRVVSAALESSLAKVVLVLGHEAQKLKTALGPIGRCERLQIVINEGYQAGMAGSLQAGLRSIKGQFPSVMFLLIDQPLIDAGAINLLLHRFWETDKGICLPKQGNRPGNPVCFSSFFYEEILRIQGDKGARELIQKHADDVLFVESDNPCFFTDLDSAEDLERLSAIHPDFF